MNANNNLNVSNSLATSLSPTLTICYGDDRVLRKFGS